MKAPESAQKNINLRILSGVYIITPPIEKQDRFMEFISGLEQLNQMSVKSSAELSKMFETVLARALRGDLEI
jgi:type I restriction enzyme S subunit